MAQTSKVLMFGWEFPPYNSGGLGVACLGLTNSLIQAGVDVTFVLPKKFEFDYPHIKFAFADTTVTITKENFAKWKTFLNPYSVLQRHLLETYEIQKILETQDLNPNEDIYTAVLAYQIHSQKIIQEEIENGGFDVIHCHDWLTIKPGLLAKKMTGKKLIFHVHATEWDRTGGSVNQLIYDIEKDGIEKADIVIAVSEFTRQTLIKEYGADPDKVKVVHNGIDYYKESTGKKDLELVQNLQQIKKMGYSFVTFIGRLTMQKGAEYFLRSAQKCIQYKPNIKFIVAGSGDMEEYLMQETARLGLSLNVIFPGFLREEKLRALYHVSDIFVMPSPSEPFGLVALEAMVHETPVIISKNSGVSEVLSHALKVDFWDTDEMAHLILSLLHHDQLHHQLKYYGKDEIKNISWQKAVEKLLRVYNS
jgi:glycosyltransferase involved in cell wall biosynthesis